MNTAFYVAIRFLLWCIGVAIPLYPILHEAPEFPVIGSPFATLSMINTAGLFRDLFYVLGPASAIAVSTTLEYVWTHVMLPRRQIVPAYFAGLAIILILFNGFGLVTAFVGFFTLPAPSFHSTLPPSPFTMYSWLIMLGLLVSFGTEMLMAVSNGRLQARDSAANVI